MPMHRRRGLTGLAVLVLTLALPTSAHAISPINPNNRPSPVPGQLNGVLPAPLLVKVAPHCRALRAAGPSLGRLFALARESRIPLGANECYRTLAAEVDNAIRANQPGNNPACVATVGQTASGKPVGHSYHGWGEAVDLTGASDTLTFADPGYAFMKRTAGSLGWNHPAFAEPGGSTCPEPWHWEWVGDGGQFGATPIRGDIVAMLPSADDHGYNIVSGLGAVGARGNAINRGSALHIPISWVIIAAAQTPTRTGYWLVGADGGVFTYGSAHFYGSTGNIKLNSPVNSIAVTKSGHGYWLVAWDGGVFSFGDARFHGSTGNIKLKSPVDSVAVTKSGNGYWLAAADGGVFSFGDARFRGSAAASSVRAPVVGIARTKSGNGYWLARANGAVHSFGDAKFHGAASNLVLPSPVVSIVATQSGNGYWLELANGQVKGFGDAHVYSH